MPALIVGIPALSSVGDLKRSLVADPEALLRLVVVVFDEDALRKQLVEPLVAAHFGAHSSEYAVTIVRRTSPAQVVYSSDSRAPIDGSRRMWRYPCSHFGPTPIGWRRPRSDRRRRRRESAYR